MSQDDLRDTARKRLEAKAGFWRQVGIFAAIAVVLVAIWFISGGTGYFWPIWPILGMSIAAVFIGINAYGPGRRVITDDQVDAEVRRMTGGDNPS